jgi:hypothetical protein
MLYYKKSLVIALLPVICTSMLSAMDLSAMDYSQQMLGQLERIYKTMADSDAVSPDIIQKLFRLTASLDTSIDQLDGAHKESMLRQAQDIQKKYQPVLRRVLQQRVAATHAINRKKVYALMSNLVYSALVSGSIPLVYQGLQIGTGNLNSLDQGVLLGASLEGVLVELVRHGVGVQYARISNMAAEVSRGELVPFAAGVAAAVTNATVTVASPTKWGVLMAGIKYETLAVVTRMIEQEGGIIGIVKQVNVSHLLLGTPAIDREQQQVVAYVQPHVRNILDHPKVRRALMQTMVVACDSIMVGIVMHHYLNLGYADEKGIYLTIEGAALRGLVEGLASYLVNRTSGVAFTLGGGLLARNTQNMLLKGSGLGLSVTDVTTVLLHKGVQSAVYYVIDENGGIGNVTKTLISKVAHTVHQHWWRPFRQSITATLDTMINYALGRPLLS